jgi:hypothetical protein
MDDTKCPLCRNELGLQDKKLSTNPSSYFVPKSYFVSVKDCCIPSKSYLTELFLIEVRSSEESQTILESFFPLGDISFSFSNKELANETIKKYCEQNTNKKLCIRYLVMNESSGSKHYYRNVIEVKEVGTRSSRRKVFVISCMNSDGGIYRPRIKFEEVSCSFINQLHANEGIKKYCSDKANEQSTGDKVIELCTEYLRDYVDKEPNTGDSSEDERLNDSEKSSEGSTRNTEAQKPSASKVLPGKSSTGDSEVVESREGSTPNTEGQLPSSEVVLSKASLPPITPNYGKVSTSAEVEKNPDVSDKQIGKKP